jgi:hypothetical protein
MAVTYKSQPDSFLDVIWVGVIARAPTTVLGTTTTAADNVQVEFVCVKAEKEDAGLKGSGGSSSSSTGSTTGSATGAASTPTGAAVAGVQMAGPLLLGVIQRPRPSMKSSSEVTRAQVDQRARRERNRSTSYRTIYSLLYEILNPLKPL